MEFGIDWEDKFELLARVERHFGVQMLEESVLQLRTVDDLLCFVCHQLPETETDEIAIWTELRQLVADELGLRVRQVERSQRFYEDMNCGGPLRSGLPYRSVWERHPILIGLILGMIVLALVMYLKQ